MVPPQGASFYKKAPILSTSEPEDAPPYIGVEIRSFKVVIIISSAKNIKQGVQGGQLRYQKPNIDTSNNLTNMHPKLLQIHIFILHVIFCQIQHNRFIKNKLEDWLAFLSMDVLTKYTGSAVTALSEAVLLSSDNLILAIYGCSVII